MNVAIKGIQNAQLIESIFGEWQSFHDAEIHSIVLTRDCEKPRPRLEMTIHHWQLTNEVNSAGQYALRNHTLSVLRFSGLIDLMLADFNHQNVIMNLEIIEIAESSVDPKYALAGMPVPRFAVSMPATFGCEVSFKCEEICVLSAVPYAG